MFDTGRGLYRSWLERVVVRVCHGGCVNWVRQLGADITGWTSLLTDIREIGRMERCYAFIWCDSV